MKQTVHFKYLQLAFLFKVQSKTKIESKVQFEIAVLI